MTTATVETPTLEPGIHPGIDWQTYRALPYASQSILKKMFQATPAHARHAMESPGTQTADQLVGEATHAMVLEPETFGDRFAIAPRCEATTSKNKRCSNSAKVYRELDDGSAGWFCHIKSHDPWAGAPSEWDGPRVLTESQAAEARRVMEAVHAHPEFASMFELADGRELTIVWDDPETGVRCKARLDLVVNDVGIYDVKTCQSATEHEFRRAAARFGYDFQASFYNRGQAAVGFDAPHFHVVAAEKGEPGGCRIYRMHDGIFHLLDDLTSQLLAQFAECQRTGEWPGYPTHVEDISMPGWRMDEVELALRGNRVRETMDAVREEG